jgi:hypothetical protein
MRRKIVDVLEKGYKPGETKITVFQSVIEHNRFAINRLYHHYRSCQTKAKQILRYCSTKNAEQKFVYRRTVFIPSRQTLRQIEEDSSLN